MDPDIFFNFQEELIFQSWKITQTAASIH